MTIVALEEHMLPHDLNDFGDRSERIPPGCAGPLADLGKTRLAAMDAARINVQVLSFTGHTVQELPPEQSISYSRTANDRISAVLAEHPTRFRGFAQLPMAAPSAAIDELHRAIHELGFVGTMIHGQTNGRFLDHPDFDALLSAIEQTGTPVYLHPAQPPPAVRRAYYSDLRAEVAGVLATAAWGWHAENGMHVLRLAASGALERHPRLQIVVGHMGEDLPFSLARADEWLTPVTRHERSIAETVLDQVWITTAGYTTVPPLQCALSTFGEDRVLYSTDYPFSDPVQATTFIDSAPISPATRAKIFYENADRLLNLGR